MTDWQLVLAFLGIFLAGVRVGYRLGRQDAAAEAEELSECVERLCAAIED